jgi:hypothetical protein
MIERTMSSELIAKVTEGYGGCDFNPSAWLSDLRNIALVNNRGDVNLFQYETDGVYIGHFFYVSRGREALQAAIEMLARIFQEDVEVLIGITPDDKPAAKWLARKIGFKSYGPVEHVCGPCEIFILSRVEYEEDTA